MPDRMSYNTSKTGWARQGEGEEERARKDNIKRKYVCDEETECCCMDEQMKLNLYCMCMDAFRYACVHAAVLTLSV